MLLRVGTDLDNNRKYGTLTHLRLRVAPFHWLWNPDERLRDQQHEEQVEAGAWSEAVARPIRVAY